jgi:tetratricopeptide (TPR) repeat protein
MRTGHARKLVRTSLSSGSLIAADEAVRLSPGDPEAYAARAASLTKHDELALAVDDLRRAIELRPRDYRLWTELGITLNRLGNSQSALAALKEAQTLAPSYVRPHWESGLLLNELGRKDEAIKEFRLATASQPALLSKVIEFAWKTFAGDCDQIQRALEPRTNYERLSLALFFIRKEKPAEALSLIRLIDDLTPHDRRQLHDAFLRGEHFAEAREFSLMQTTR